MATANQGPRCACKPQIRWRPLVASPETRYHRQRPVPGLVHEEKQQDGRKGLSRARDNGNMPHLLQALEVPGREEDIANNSRKCIDEDYPVMPHAWDCEQHASKHHQTHGSQADLDQKHTTDDTGKNVPAHACFGQSIWLQKS